MKAPFLLLLLVLAPVTAQNETADNGTAPEQDEPAADGFDLRLAISGAAVVFLVAAFVYVAKR